MCMAGWSGAECKHASCDKGCSNNGVCDLRKGCVCNLGWLGQDCSKRACPNGCHASDGQGICRAGVCSCSPGFFGDDCGGTCGSYVGTLDGWGEPAVNETYGCSGHGRCESGKWCACEPGYTGARCESRTCLLDCAGRGLCRDGTCVCALGFGGPDCAATTAPNSRECSLGCVHMCAARCASSKPAQPISQVGETCFSLCRKTCASACARKSVTPLLFTQGLLRAPSARIEAAALATRTLQLPVPTSDAF